MTKNLVILCLSVVTSIILAIKLPLILVIYEGQVWGGEGLFSLMLVAPIFGFILVSLGIGISVIAYREKTKKSRNKIFMVGGIIYICFVLIVFISMSFFYYNVLGPPLIG